MDLLGCLARAASGTVSGNNFDSGREKRNDPGNDRGNHGSGRGVFL